MEKVALHASQQQQGILNEWKYHHHSEEEDMMPMEELNITQMAHRPPLGSGSISAREIIDAIYRAITWEQRHYAFHTALSAFSHKNTDLHSYEIDLGAVHALVLQLGACLSSGDNNSHSTFSNNTRDNNNNNNEEILVDLILKCLYQILSYSATKRKMQLWQDLGSTELLPLLLRLPPSQVSWSVLRLLCKLKNAKSILLSFPSLMKQIVEVIERESTSNNKNNNNNNRNKSNYPELIILALGTLKDLSFKSGGKDNEKQYIWRSISNLTTTFSKICEEPKVETTRHREYIVTIWWNLAICPAIAYQMISIKCLLSTLQNLMISSTSSVTLRRSAIAALGTLVTTTTTTTNSNNKNNKHDLPNDIDRDNESIWKSLIQLIKHEVDTDCRRRALRTIRCLVTAAVEEEYPSELLEILVEAAKTDSDEDTRLQALEALRHFRTKTPQWTEAFVSIVVVTSRQSSMMEMLSSRSHATACDILKSKCDPVTLISCIERKGFLEALSVADVEVISEIISIIANNGGKEKLLSHPALSLIAQVIVAGSNNNDDGSMIALQIIQKLTQTTSENRSIMAKYDPLINAIVNFCLLSTNGEEKEFAKSIILALVAEL